MGHAPGSNAPPGTDAPPKAPDGQRLGFRGVPWLWRDLIVGLASVIAWRVAAGWLDVSGWPPAALWLPWAIQLLGMAWMLGYPFWVARRRRARLPRPSLRAAAVEAAVAVPALLVIWVQILMVRAAWEGLGGAPPENPLGPAARAGDWESAAAFTLLAALIAPLNEEVFFRGMLYNGLRQRCGPWLAAVLQAGVFGVLHSFGYVHAAYAALLGAAMAALYEWRRTLLAPIFVHALMNLAFGVVMVWAALSAANGPALGIRALPQDGGCRITEVQPGSGADAAELRVGDVVSAVDGRPVPDIDAVAAIVREKRVGDRVRIQFVRDGEARTVDAVLKRRRG
jgi:membrane protease YdiL (CAAX protease family)